MSFSLLILVSSVLAVQMEMDQPEVQLPPIMDLTGRDFTQRATWRDSGLEQLRLTDFGADSKNLATIQNHPKFPEFVTEMLTIYRQFIKASRIEERLTAALAMTSMVTHKVSYDLLGDQIEGDQWPTLNMFLLSQGITRYDGLLEAFIDFEAEFEEFQTYCFQHQKFPEGFDAKKLEFPSDWPEEEREDMGSWSGQIRAQVIEYMINIAIQENSALIGNRALASYRERVVESIEDQRYVALACERPRWPLVLETMLLPDVSHALARLRDDTVRRQLLRDIESYCSEHGPIRHIAAFQDFLQFQIIKKMAHLTKELVQELVPEVSFWTKGGTFMNKMKIISKVRSDRKPEFFGTGKYAGRVAKFIKDLKYGNQENHQRLVDTYFRVIIGQPIYELSSGPLAQFLSVNMLTRFLQSPPKSMQSVQLRMHFRQITPTELAQLYSYAYVKAFLKKGYAPENLATWLRSQPFATFEQDEFHQTELVELEMEKCIKRLLDQDSSVEYLPLEKIQELATKYNVDFDMTHVSFQAMRQVLSNLFPQLERSELKSIFKFTQQNLRAVKKGLAKFISKKSEKSNKSKSKKQD